MEISVVEISVGRRRTQAGAHAVAALDARGIRRLIDIAQRERQAQRA
jgi:hypothetical protein